jgi:hypothetical protein
MGHKLTLPTTLPTLSQNQIKNVENVENVENEETKEGANCPICLENIGTSKTTTTVCHHSFHSTCLASWLQQHDTCPLCRRQCTTTLTMPYRIGQTYQIKMKNSAQFIQCGVLAVIFPPNEHGNTCFKFTFNHGGGTTYERHFFDNIYDFSLL